MLRGRVHGELQWMFYDLSGSLDLCACCFLNQLSPSCKNFRFFICVPYLLPVHMLHADFKTFSIFFKFVYGFYEDTYIPIYSIRNYC